GPPAFHGVVQAVDDLLPGPRGPLGTGAMPEAEPERRDLPGSQSDPCRRGGAVHSEADRGGQKKLPLVAQGGKPAGYWSQDRLDEAISWPGRVADLRFDLAARACEPTQQHARRVCTQVVTPLVTADSEGVGEHRCAARDGESGLQHHRLIDVLAAGPELACGLDREIAAGRIKQPAEH